MNAWRQPMCADCTVCLLTALWACWRHCTPSDGLVDLLKVLHAFRQPCGPAEGTARLQTALWACWRHCTPSDGLVALPKALHALILKALWACWRHCTPSDGLVDLLKALHAFWRPCGPAEGAHGLVGLLKALQAFRRPIIWIISDKNYLMISKFMRISFMHLSCISLYNIKICLWKLLIYWRFLIAISPSPSQHCLIIGARHINNFIMSLFKRTVKQLYLITDKCAVKQLYLFTIKCTVKQIYLVTVKNPMLNNMFFICPPSFSIFSINFLFLYGMETPLCTIWKRISWDASSMGINYFKSVNFKSVHN